MWCVDDVCCVCGCYNGGISSDGGDLHPTLCKYDLRERRFVSSELGQGCDE